MTDQPKSTADGIAAPLRHSVFRRIWLASLLSNLGLLIQAVGAAWAMTQMTSSADKVALVQTALMLPVMLISMPAGAVADMYDRRIVALVSLSIALAGATALTVLSWLGQINPQILLTLCFVVGSGMALFGPAWQSSVSEQVPTETLPSAVALNGISYNIARSFGPAIGGIVVAAAGAVAAFAANALLYLPLLVVLFLWRRVSEPSKSTARAAEPRHRLRRALHRQLAFDQDRAGPHLCHRPDRWFGVGADAAGGARPAARRRADLRHHARRLRHGRGGRRAQYRHDPQAAQRRGGDPRLRAVDGWRDHRGRLEPHAGVDGSGAGGRRRRLDARGRALQYRRATVRAALGGGPFAGRVPGFDRGRDRNRKLGLGPPDRCVRCRDRTAGFGRR